MSIPTESKRIYREEKEKLQDIDSNIQHKQQYLWRDLWDSTNGRAKEVTNKKILNYLDYGEDDILQSISASVNDTDVMGSDKLLVTFDYGYSDSIDELLTNGQYDEHSFSEYAAATSDELDEISVETGVVLGAVDTSCENDDYEGHDGNNHNDSIISIEQNDEQQSMAYWFKSNYAPYAFDGCKYRNVNEISTEFPVHHVQYTQPFADSVLSLNSTFTEYDVDVTDMDSPNTFTFRRSAGMINNIQRIEQIRAAVDDKQEETEEEFFDSIECAKETVL